MATDKAIIDTGLEKRCRGCGTPLNIWDHFKAQLRESRLFLRPIKTDDPNLCPLCGNRRVERKAQE